MTDFSSSGFGSSGGYVVTGGETARTREQTTGEWWLHLLGKPEEALVRALRAENPFASTTYDTQDSFAKLLADKGFDPIPAAILGVGAAIANPLDPLNKLKLLQLTKVGKAAEAATAAGKAFKVGKDGLARLEKSGILDAITKAQAKLEKGALSPENAKILTRSISSLEQNLKDVDSLNDILVAAQKRGVSIDKLKLAPTTIDQIRAGQRHLIGFSSPTSLDHLRLLGGGKEHLDDASIFPAIPTKLQESLVKGATGLKDAIGPPVKAAVTHVLNKIGISVPTKTTKELASQFKAIVANNKGKTEELHSDLTHWINSLIKDGVEPSEIEHVMQQLEFPGVAEKQIALSALDEAKLTYESPDEILKLDNHIKDVEKIIDTAKNGAHEVDLPINASPYTIIDRVVKLSSKRLASEKATATEIGLSLVKRDGQFKILLTKGEAGSGSVSLYTDSIFSLHIHPTYEGPSAVDLIGQSMIGGTGIIIAGKSVLLYRPLKRARQIEGFRHSFNSNPQFIKELYNQDSYRGAFDSAIKLIDELDPTLKSIVDEPTKLSTFNEKYIQPSKLIRSSSGGRFMKFPATDDRVRKIFEILETILTEELRNAEIADIAVTNAEHAKILLQTTFQEAAGKYGSVFDIPSGLALSTQQRLRLTPDGITDSDIVSAVSAYKASQVSGFSVGRTGKHRGRIVGEYVVVEAGSAKARSGNLDAMDKIFGQRQWVRHTDADGVTYLITKRLPFSTTIDSTSKFTATHLHNLEVIAAQLGLKKRMISGIHASDIIVTPYGGIQIINPDVIADAKTAKDALTNSEVAISQLAEELQQAQASFPFLQTVEAAKSVPGGVQGFSYRAAINGGEFANSHELLMSAANNKLHQAYVRAGYGDKASVSLFDDPESFELANNIAAERAKIKAQLAKGEQPYIKPIEYFYDDKGTLFIKDGRDRLTASVLEGIKAVPIKEAQLYDLATNVPDTNFVGSVKRLGNMVNEAEKTANGLKPKIVDQSYALVDDSGKVLHYPQEDVIVSDKVTELLYQLTTMGARYVGRNARNARIKSINSLLEAKFGSIQDGMTYIARAAEKSPDYKQFVKELQSILSDGRRGMDLDNVLAHARAHQVFGTLKNESIKSIDALARDGILLTDPDIRRIQIATQENGVAFRTFDPTTNSLVFYSKGHSVEQLKKKAADFLGAGGGAHEIEPLAGVKLIGQDGDSSLVVRDFVSGEHPLSQTVSVDNRPFRIAAEQRAELEKQGILVYSGKNLNEVREALEKRGLNYGVLLEEDSGFRRGDINRPTFAYFITKSGDVVIGTNRRDVTKLFKDVFGEADPQYAEFGLFTTGRIYLSNPFGGRISKLGNRELANLKNRLVENAQKFKDLGFSEGTVLKVNVPFDDAVWRSMYGERVTIGDILDPEFKFKVPKELVGHAVDNSVDAPTRYLDIDFDKAKGTVAIEKTRLANDKLNQLFIRLRDINDELFLQEAKAGIPVAYHTSYVGRSITDASKAALNDAYLKYPARDSNTFKHLESFLKGRVFTDLTSIELNQIIKRVQKEGGGDVNAIISDIVAKYRDGYKIARNPETANRIIALAEILPNGMDFYHTNPIYATSLRIGQGERATTRQQIVDALKASDITVWHGSVQDFNALKVGTNADIAKAEKDIADIQGKIVDVRAKLDGIAKAGDDVVTDAEAKLKSQLDSLTVDLADKIVARQEYLDKLGKGKTLSMYIDTKASEVWIKGEDALDMLSKGIIKADDIAGDAGDALVRVSYAKYQSALDQAGKEIFLFPPEVGNVVKRFFATTTKDGFSQFLKHWDEIHAAWRAWTLYPIPSYHIRNMVSSVFMGWLGGVTNKEVYQDSFRVMSLLSSYRKGAVSRTGVQEALASMKFANAAGQVATGEDLLREFVRLGGFHGGRHRNEFSRFGTLRRASEFEKLVEEAGMRGVSELTGSWIYDNSVLRSGVSIAAWTENRVRFAAFIDAFKKGHIERQGDKILTGYEAAIMHVKKLFYDYTDLTQFERDWLIRVIPFYAWSRHNIPRMVETLITDPVKHYRFYEMIDGIERNVVGGPVDESSLPEWVRERFGFVVAKEKNGSYIVKTGDGFFPMLDVYKLISGTGILGALRDGITPFVKVPIEQIANLSFYTGEKIENYPGERARSYLLGNLGFSRRTTNEGPLGVLNLVLNESLFNSFFRPGAELTKPFDMLTDPRHYSQESPGFMNAVASLLVGRAYTIDPQRTRAAIFRDWNRTQSFYTSIQRRAAASGDTKTVDDINNKLAWLRLQNPGVG